MPVSRVPLRRTVFERTSVVVLLCMLAMSVAWADRPKIGLVLGGGGARGAAHVGVLKVIERERIPVDYIAGTSMGAVVGALYASGLSAGEIERILSGIDWQTALGDHGPRSQHSIRNKMDDVEFSLAAEAGIAAGKLKFPAGFIQGQQLELIVRRHLAHVGRIKDFDRLPIPFRAVATDLAMMKPFVFNGGDIATAVRASMSVPGAFEPVRFDGMVLVDGGIVDNVPVDVARDMGADVLIVVDVRTPLSSAAELDSLGAVLNQVINGLMTAETDRELRKLGEHDVLIYPELGKLSSSDFRHATDAIRSGELAALTHVDRLRQHSVPPSEYEAIQAARVLESDAESVIADIEVVHDKSGTRGAVHALLDWQLGEPLNVDRIESSISTLYSDGSYSKIQYEVIPQDNGNVLSIRPTDKSWGPTVVEAALRVSDNFDGDSNYLLSVRTLSNNVNSLGAKWINRLRLGLRTGFFSEFYQPISVGRRSFVSTSLEYAGRDVTLSMPTEQSLWRDRRTILALDIGRTFSNHAELRVGYEYGYADTSLDVGDIPVAGGDGFTISQLSLEYIRDTLDDSGFPREGLFLDAKINKPLGSDTEAPAYFLDVYKPLPIGRGTLLLGLSASSVEDDGLPFQEIITLGGLTRLSGYQPDELFGNHAGLVSAAFYRRFGHQESRLFDTPLYVGGSLEAGNVWLTNDDIDADSLIYAGSLFAGVDSPIGPVYLAYGRAEGGIDSVYLSVGSLFRRLPRR